MIWGIISTRAGVANLVVIRRDDQTKLYPKLHYTIQSIFCDNYNLLFSFIAVQYTSCYMISLAKDMFIKN